MLQTAPDPACDEECRGTIHLASWFLNKLRQWHSPRNFSGQQVSHHATHENHMCLTIRSLEYGRIESDLDCRTSESFHFHLFPRSRNHVEMSPIRLWFEP